MDADDNVRSFALLPSKENMARAVHVALHGMYDYSKIKQMHGLSKAYVNIINQVPAYIVHAKHDDISVYMKSIIEYLQKCKVLQAACVVHEPDSNTVANPTIVSPAITRIIDADASIDELYVCPTVNILAPPIAALPATLAQELQHNANIFSDKELFETHILKTGTFGVDTLNNKLYSPCWVAVAQQMFPGKIGIKIYKYKSYESPRSIGNNCIYGSLHSDKCWCYSCNAKITHPSCSIGECNELVLRWKVSKSKQDFNASFHPK